MNDKITTYESTSKVPLLRNYYFHEIIDGGENRFLMLFDDCLVGSFATDNNIEVFFYGFYNSVENGKLIEGYFDASTKINAVDNLIKKSYSATADLSAYVYVMNTIRIFPMIALMVIVVTMLTHSILALNGVKTCKTFGSTIKVIGSFLWFSGVVAAILTIITAFFVQRGLITVVTIISLFLALLVRAIFFIISEIKNKPNRIVYISCEPSTLARDIELLKKHYEVTSVTPVDMFPRSFHVETIVGLALKK